MATGRLTVKHTPGAVQLADLATNMVTKERLWELLGLWGFIGGKVAKIWDALKMKMMIFAMMIVSLVTPTQGAPVPEGEKEAIQVSGADELLLVTMLVCVASVAIWELGKFIFKWCLKQYKGVRKAKKLDAVRRLAAEAARRELQSATASGTMTEDDLPSTSMATSTPRVRKGARLRTSRATPEHVPATPSPRFVQGPEEGSEQGGFYEERNYQVRNVAAFSDRPRVIGDTLSLMTVEALQQGLRKTGHPVS